MESTLQVGRYYLFEYEDASFSYTANPLSPPLPQKTLGRLAAMTSDFIDVGLVWSKSTGASPYMTGLIIPKKSLLQATPLSVAPIA